MKSTALAGVVLATLALTGCGAELVRDYPTPEAPTLPGTSERAPADKINLCTGTLAEVAPSTTDLGLTVSFPDAEVGAKSVSGTVTLTNNGSGAVTGHTGSRPAVTVSQNGIVLWHSNGGTDLDAVDVDLAPGESIDYPANFSPVACGVDDDLAEQFSNRLPALPSGVYDISAAIDLLYDGGVDLVTGPSQKVTLQ